MKELLMVVFYRQDAMALRHARKIHFSHEPACRQTGRTNDTNRINRLACGEYFFPQSHKGHNGFATNRTNDTNNKIACGNNS